MHSKIDLQKYSNIFAPNTSGPWLPTTAKQNYQNLVPFIAARQNYYSKSWKIWGELDIRKPGPHVCLSRIILVRDWDEPNLHDNKSTHNTLLLGSYIFVKLTHWYPRLKSAITFAQGCAMANLSGRNLNLCCNEIIISLRFLMKVLHAMILTCWYF